MAGGGRFRKRDFLVLGWAAVVLGVLGSAPLVAVDVNGSLIVDPDFLAGTDGQGNVLLFAPDPVNPGSSISHWDTSATPNLLMEPNLTADLQALAPDLTLHQLRDVGWPTNGGSTININYLDAADEGFNDPTLGAQRKSALESVVNAWAGRLRSDTPLNVDVTFESLPCSTGSGVLAQAGPSFIFESFPGIPVARTWYPGALAEALSGMNLSSTLDGASPTAGDLSLSFNSDIDTGCLQPGSRFHYGTGPAPPSTLSFVNVALHEMAHGLGFLSLVNLQSGQNCCSFLGPDLILPDIYSRFVLDNTQNRRWHRMNDQQRAASARNGGNVVWAGPRVRSRVGNFLEAGPGLRINSPGSLAGFYRVGTASFGLPVGAIGVTGDLATAQPVLACGPLSNPQDLAGRIAVIDRGDCNFDDKVRNAEDAGAIAVVMVNNVAGDPPLMGGDDSTITIPTLSVSQVDGEAIKTEIARPPVEPPDPPEPPETEGPSDCVPDALTLCLNDGRFKVTSDWMTMDGMSGQGQATALTDDTGYFWFFNAANVEAVVKALDGCGFNNRRWIFAGGLTNVQVDLRVVDTDNGTVKRYSNPLGTAFQPIQDTNAFATCP